MSAAIKWTYSGRAGGLRIDSNGPQERDYSREFLVATTTAYTESQVLVVTGVPRMLDPYGADISAKCIEVRVNQDKDNELLWRGTARYSTLTGNQQQQQQENPLLRPAIWRYESIENLFTRATDADGTPFKLSNGRPLQSPPQVAYSTSRYTITRNQLEFSNDLADSYASSVNDAAWYGKAAYTVKCEGIQAEEVYEADYHYWRVTYVIHVNPRTWRLEVANRDTFYKDGANLKPVWSDDGTTIVDQPGVFLNNVGGKWTSSDDESEKYLTFDTYTAKDFSTLAL